MRNAAADSECLTAGFDTQKYIWIVIYRQYLSFHLGRRNLATSGGWERGIRQGMWRSHNLQLLMQIIWTLENDTLHLAKLSLNALVSDIFSCTVNFEMNNNLMVHVLPVTYDDYYFTATMNICNDNHLCVFLRMDD